LYLLDLRSCNFLIKEEVLEDVNKEIQLQYVSFEQRRLLLRALRRTLSHCTLESTSIEI